MQLFRKQRAFLEESIDSYFETAIDIAPRALEALQGSYRVLLGMECTPTGISKAILQGLLNASPACLAALQDAGIPVEALSHGSIEEESWEPGHLADFTPEDFFFTLDNIFCGDAPGRWDPPAACPRYKAVQKSGRLLETDLLSAMTETLYTGPEFFTELVTAEDVYYHANPLGKKLLDAGFIRGDEFIERYDEDSQQYSVTSPAKAQFDALRAKLPHIPIIDPSHDLFQFAIWQEPGGRIRVRPFGAGSLGRVGEQRISTTPELMREGVFQPAIQGSIFTADAIAQLEDMVNDRRCPEAHFQRFFVEHPEFLTGLDYSRVHPQLVLHNETGSNRIPDFMLEPMTSAFCDILELKLPHDEMVRRARTHTRTRFRDFVQEAIAQLVEYRRYFENRLNRQDFHARYGLQAYFPAMILVVGRRHHFRSDVERTELRALMPNDLQLWTYDDLLERARRFQACAVEGAQVDAAKHRSGRHFSDSFNQVSPAPRRSSRRPP